MATFEEGLKLTRGKGGVKLAAARDGWAFILEVRGTAALPQELKHAFEVATDAFMKAQKKAKKKS
jgi:hypothetical protein